VVLGRDAASETWVCDANAIIGGEPRRKATLRSRREWRAFLYIGGVVASLGLVAAVAALVLLGGYRPPVPFARGILGQGTAAATDESPPPAAVLSTAREPEAMRPERAGESKRGEPTTAARRHRP
jgi:hypothetical protein